MSFYAVAKGVKTGIFNTWAECASYTQGYGGSIYKKFKTNKEAEKFIEDYTIKLENLPAKKPKEEKPVIEINPEGYLLVKGKQTALPHLLQFDGGSEPNPGPSAGGAVLFEPGTTDPVFERYEFIPHATNNEAEYNGLIIGLQEAAELGIKNLLIQGDSNLIVNQFAGNWKIKAQNLVSPHKTARALLAQFEFVAIKQIPREQNAHADSLTNEGIKNQDSILRMFE